MANTRWSYLTRAQVDLGADYDRRIAELTKCANSPASLVRPAVPQEPIPPDPRPQTFAEAREAYAQSSALQTAFGSERLYLAHFLGEQSR